MNSLEERDIECPYCGESISILLEYLHDEQQYIEDCQVCCRPINFTVWQDFTGEFNLSVTHENE